MKNHYFDLMEAEVNLIDNINILGKDNMMEPQPQVGKLQRNSPMDIRKDIKRTHDLVEKSPLTD